MDDVGGVVGDEDDTGVGVDEDEGVELCELDGVDVGVELLLCELVDDEEDGVEGEGVELDGVGCVVLLCVELDDVVLVGVVELEEELVVLDGVVVELVDDVELCVELKEEMKLFRLLQYSSAHACATLQE